MLRYIVPKEKENLTIKEILKKELNLSDRLIAKLKRQKAILYQGKNIYVNEKLKEGDELLLILEEEKKNEIMPQSIKIDIVFEDPYILVINKPANLVVHPSQLHPLNTLANGVIYYFMEQGLDIKFRPVHRIDKDTSGLLVIAKNQYIHHQLSNQLMEKKVKRKYVAIVEGRIEKEEEIVDAPIARKEESIIERIVSEEGQRAITHYKILKRFQDMTFIELQLYTGRTHQIRVHMKHIGHPLLGDTLYGKESDKIQRQALHAFLLGFTHPITKEDLIFKADLPIDMKKVLEKNK